MPSTMFRILLILIAFNLTVSAQDSEQQISTSIRFLAWQKTDTRLTPTLTTAKGGNVKIEYLSAYDRTSPIKYRGPAKLVFTSDGAIPDENNTRIIKLNPTWKNILILVAKDKKHASGLSMTALNDSTDNFPWGSYRIINTTGRALKIKIDKKVVPIANDKKPKTIISNSKEGMINILAALKESKEPLFGCISPHSKNTRKLIILSPSRDKRLGPLAVRIIPEKKIGNR
jgi:hypothetical protein